MEDSMDKILVLKPVLKKISEGSIFRLLFAWAMRIEAALTVLGVLYGSVKLWGLVRGGGAPASAYFGLLIVQIALLVLGFVTVNILLVRAEDIERQPVGADYIVTPIVVIFQKTLGEIGAAVYAILGVAGGLFIWISGGEIPLPIPGLSGGDGFTGGLIAMILGLTFGFAILAFSYFVAELTGAVVDIARNTKK
jgi:hypothetical protein